MQVTKAGIERIKASNELSAVVAERGIEVKRKGRHLVASCPFHEEEEASFTITPGKGLYHCFGCGAAGDVIGFVTKHDRVSFGGALEVLARRSNLDLTKLMEEPRRAVHVNVSRPFGGTPLEALTPPPEVLAEAEGKAAAPAASNGKAAAGNAPPAAILSRVVEHYHKTFTEREDAQAYLKKRGLTDVDLWRTFKLGYADGSLQKLIPKTGDLRQQLLSMGILTPEGRELLGGCIVFPIPDPLSGEWTTLYGRGMRTSRHCYLPGPLRGVLNFQAAKSASEVILTESVIDALSFLEAGITSAIPLYGTNGFTPDHLDALLKSPTRRVVICLDNDEAGKKAAFSLQSKLQKAGLQTRIAALPAGVKDVNDLLVSRNGDASEALRAVLSPPGVSAQRAEPSPSREKPAPQTAASTSPAAAREEGLVVRCGERTYHAKAFNLQATDRLRVVLRAEQDARFLVDAVDLYSARSRKEYSKRAAVRLAAVSSRPLDPAVLEEELLQVLTKLEALKEEAQKEGAPQVPAMSEEERRDALAFLKRPDLLDQIARDIDALGYVGEEVTKRLLYLVAVSRKLDDPLSAIVLSQSGAGKSGATEVIEQLCPPEDVILFTRLTPQSLYYTEPGFLDRKLVIVEERYGSLEADYSIRVLQSRKKLIAAAPIKDPQTGNLRTKTFIVEARAAFIEATTASGVNHENATRCFELGMDESAEQTQRIHERQRLMKTEAGLRLRAQAEGLRRLHGNAQRLLEPLAVVIPYADKLTFPSAWMRTRRDHARFLNLIEVSAFLHQHQRGRSGAGAILADVADYAVAYRLAGQVLQDTLSDLKKPLRDAYARIQELSLKGKDGSFSRREVREALQVPDSTVRGWLADLVELEYLEMEASRGGAGKGTRYRPSEKGPRLNTVLGLLSVEELGLRLGR